METAFGIVRGKKQKSGDYGVYFFTIWLITCVRATQYLTPMTEALDIDRKKGSFLFKAGGYNLDTTLMEWVKSLKNTTDLQVYLSLF